MTRFAVPRGKHSRQLGRWRPSYRLGVWTLIVPFLAGSVLLILLPALLSGVFAFSRYNGLAPPTFAGLDVFRDLLGDKELRRSLVSTGIFLVIAVPLRIAGGLALALLMYRREAGVAAGRVGVYAPTVVPDAAMALVWLWIVNPFYGPVGVLARASGLDIPVLLDPWGSRLTIIAIAVFTLGEGFLITLAARRELPEALFDVARTEGARGFGLFRRVTLPMLAPVLGLLTARDIVLSMQVTLVPILLLTQGDPAGATLTLPVFIYEAGFRELRFGSAAALALVLVALTSLVVAVQFRVLRRWTRAGALD